jgi:hypothetical protein
MSTMASPIPWDKADKGQVHQVLIQHVQRIEREQSDMYDRFIKLARLYDPNSDRDNSSSDKLGNVTENVCASNVDTVCAAIAATDVRSRFMTDGANWAMQRIARHLEWYAAEVSADLGVAAKCRKAFKSSPIKGTALNKVYIDSFDRVCVEPTRADDIIVDESDLRPDGRERELHQRMMCTAEDLIAEFPDKEDAINRAAQKGRGLTRMWADYRPVPQGRVVVLETWKPPIGVKGRKGYKPGRHMKVIDGEDLLDETWEEDFCPFAKMVWSEKEDGWFGISGLERIAGHQRVINKGNWQTDRLIDQFAVPTTYVDMANASIAVKATNRLGTIAVTKNGFIPKTMHPPAVSPEVYKRTADMKNSAFEEFGVSRLAAQSAKPAGIDSGIALREYRDQTTQRFSLQEKAFEKFVLDTMLLMLWCCKKLGRRHRPSCVTRASARSASSGRTSTCATSRCRFRQRPRCRARPRAACSPSSSTRRPASSRRTRRATCCSIPTSRRRSRCTRRRSRTSSTASTRSRTATCSCPSRSRTSRWRVARTAGVLAWRDRRTGRDSGIAASVRRSSRVDAQEAAGRPGRGGERECRSEPDASHAGRASDLSTCRSARAASHAVTRLLMRSENRSS